MHIQRRWNRFLQGYTHRYSKQCESVQSHFTLTIGSPAQTILRRISVQEIREAIATGKIIEDYPEDKYGPSCLVLGFTTNGKAIHVQCSYPSRPLVKIITVYEPDPNEWIGYEQRRG